MPACSPSRNRAACASEVVQTPADRPYSVSFASASASSASPALITVAIGPEDLLAVHAHLVRGRDEQRRLEEVAIGLALEPSAALRELRPLVAPDVEVLEVLLELVGAHDRTDSVPSARA